MVNERKDDQKLIFGDFDFVRIGDNGYCYSLLIFVWDDWYCEFIKGLFKCI